MILIRENMCNLRKAIDIHSHFNHGSQFDSSEGDDYRCSIEFLKKEHLRLNIPILQGRQVISIILSKTR